MSRKDFPLMITLGFAIDGLLLTVGILTTVFGSGGGFAKTCLMLGLIGFGALAALTLRATRIMDQWSVWLEGALDAVPMPITVTDLNMGWVFINKTTEGLLRRTRDQVRGHHCSEWKADICGTEKCGVAGLRRGRERTSYNQKMPDRTQRRMQVDTSYIRDRNGRKIGHAEIVTDVDAQSRMETLYRQMRSSMQEITAAMTEISAQTQSSAAHSQSASALATETRRAMKESKERMEQLFTAMTEIDQSSREIAKMNKIINEIAFQTNLLALNAAVEAARAGDAGKGFAVVAEEVRNLSLKASEAAKEINALVDGSTAKVSRGSTLAKTTMSAMAEVDTNIDKVEALIANIAGATRDQSGGMDTVSSGLHQLERITQSGGQV